MAKPMLCTRCLNEGAPARKTKGSLAVEVVLWLLFCLPGLIYSVWRQTNKYEACARCGATELVPLDSPAAARLRGGR